MYDWTTHTHTHLGGHCSHGCVYCYVQAMGERFPEVKAKYSGPPCVLQGELTVKYGKGRTIFVEHMADLFANGVADDMIGVILDHCREFPENTFVFQSKNPARMARFIGLMPPSVILGTTIETNRPTPAVSSAPNPLDRYEALQTIRAQLKNTTAKIFVTVEALSKPRSRMKFPGFPGDGREPRGRSRS